MAEESERWRDLCPSILLVWRERYMQVLRAMLSKRVLPAGGDPIITRYWLRSKTT